VITLTTDFGEGSPYVAQMKGVILSLLPGAAMVDLSHAIPPQNVHQAALVLGDVCPRFPPHTIHVVVVDPGVGTEREILAARIDQQIYLAPDNGLLDVLWSRHGVGQLVALLDAQYWLPEPSPTFHGRDILAPVAARLAQGVRLDQLGPPRIQPVRLTWPGVRLEPRKVEGSVLLVDAFGNLITNITREFLASAPTGVEPTIRCADQETRGIVRTYGERPPRTLLALFGSGGRLELAIAGGHAAAMLGAHVGARVTVTW
jgi:hypothetical protein